MPEPAKPAATTSPQAALAFLTRRARECALLNSIESLLGWDQQTMLPEQAHAWRAEQSVWISSHAHALWTSPEVGDALATAAAAPPESLDTVARANLREWARSYRRARLLPEDLVKASAEAAALAHPAWVRARERSDFQEFAPHLTRLLELAKERAACWRDDLDPPAAHPCDPLFDHHEPGMRQAELARLFAQMRPRLQELVAAGLDKPAPPELPPGPYPSAAQEAFNREVAAACGFDFTKGRLDASPHPFCSTLGPADVRLTTRYNEQDFTDSLLSVLHEAGHGLYEQGLPPERFGEPAGEAASLAIHESQSRLWENHIGRSVPFWERWLPRARAFFPQLAVVTPETVAAHLAQVKRTPIRVEADPVSYDLHIILRFEIECALLEGALPVHQLPAAWNARFRELFGFAPPNDAQGCLQDIHWSGGGFGYFPTYTLGNLAAAQLIEAARRDVPGLAEKLAAADYAPLLAWLRTAIHRRGKVHQPGELIAQATGSALSPQDHLQFLGGLVKNSCPS